MVTYHKTLRLAPGSNTFTVPGDTQSYCKYKLLHFAGFLLLLLYCLVFFSFRLYAPCDTKNTHGRTHIHKTRTNCVCVRIMLAISFL